MHQVLDPVAVHRKIYSAIRDCVAVETSHIEHLLQNLRADMEKLEKEREYVKTNPQDDNISNKRSRRNCTVPEEKMNRQRKGKYCRQNLESVETTSKDRVCTNGEYYKQQINKLSSMTDSNTHVSSEHITHFIEQMVHKGSLERRNDPNSHDEDWFSSERQHLVRMQLLKRCFAANDSTMSLVQFFKKFSEGLFGEPYNCDMDSYSI